MLKALRLDQISRLTILFWGQIKIVIYVFFLGSLPVLIMLGFREIDGINFYP